ncbi:MAG TPA: ABC transporter ATP-binding protein [Saprospiraceae bacterium]|nr:ABC transporter ATP-binding protein [Saprospiraceae bacterium]
MIEVRRLAHQYSNQDRSIEYPDFHCGSGEELLILGPSGSGKSTLLHILGGFLKPSRGEVKMSARSLQEMNTKERNRFRQDFIGIVFQKHHFIRSLKVFENLKYAAAFSKSNRTDDQLLELLEFLGLEDLKKQAVNTLSEGQKQRLSVARALVHKPAILLADEPTSSLDDQNCRLVAELLIRSKEEYGATLVVVSHDHRLMPYFANKIELGA